VRTVSRGGVEWPELLSQPPACSPPPYMGAAAAPPRASCDAGSPNSIASVAEPGSDAKAPSGCRSPCDGSVVWRLTC